MEARERVVKILVLGDSGVGKSCFSIRYANGTFDLCFTACSIGNEFFFKRLEKKGHRLKMQVWDTAGQERFRSFSRNYFRDTKGVFFAFDLTSPESFENVSYWLRTVEENSILPFVKILIGTKSDLVDKRAVPNGQIIQFCRENDLTFLETSAKDNINITEAFDLIITKIIDENLLDSAVPPAAGVVDLTTSLDEPAPSCSC